MFIPEIGGRTIVLAAVGAIGGVPGKKLAQLTA
jgi:hypothetical protein